MANVALSQILNAPVITRVISRLKTPMSKFQDFMGMGPGGSATSSPGGHFTGYDIFDKTRKIATGRAPGTGPATIAAQPIGHVSVKIYRSHEKLPILEERVFRTRPLGKGWGNVDARGQGYITKQEQFMAQRFKNSREFMVSRMFRGGFDLKVDGENWIPVEKTAGTITIDFQIPAGNISAAVPGITIGSYSNIISASFATASTDIITIMMTLNAAFEEAHGYPLRHVWLNTTTFGPLLENTQLSVAAGTANTIFNEFRPTGLRSEEGIADTGLEFVFKALPWLKWHLYDGGLDVDGTFSKFIPDNYAIFLPDPSSDWAEMHEGSEIVRENVVDQGSERYGLAAWTTPVIDPAGWELKTVDNCIPCLYIPKCVVYAKIS